MAKSLEEKYQKQLKTIARNIKAARNAKGISQTKVTQFGFDVRNYQRLESGEHSPSLFTLFKIAESFDVSLQDLMKA